MAEQKYWLGMDELHETPEVAHRTHNEFEEELPLLEMVNEQAGNNPTSRRDFLKYLGFSVTAATLASCEMPVRKAIPYVFAPEEIKPGIATWYASTYADGSDYGPILVKTRDGRPIKIEGNDLSSITHGGTSARMQASVLSLYDNNRKKGPTLDGKKLTWFEADRQIPGRLNIVVSEGKQIVILTSSIVSPATRQLIADFKAKYPTVKHVMYDPVSYSGMLDANLESFGRRAVPYYALDKAEVVVSFGADFLGTWLAPVQFASQYAKHRKPVGENPKMSRHIQVEGTLSMTGANADVRHSMRPSAMKLAMLHLYNNIAAKAGAPAISGLPAIEKADKVKAMADELWAARGKSLVFCGCNHKDAQIVANAINDLLGNYGSTIDWARETHYKLGDDQALMDLVKDMQAGRVGAIMVHNCNPAYDNALADAFRDAMGSVNLRINFASTHNETDELVQYCTPANHYLESWGDAEAVKGHLSLAQPAIRNIFDTRQFEDSLIAWMQDTIDPADYDETPGFEGEIEPTEVRDNVALPLKPYRSKFYNYLKDYWEANVFPRQSAIAGFQAFWDKSLHDGVMELPPGSAETNNVFSADATAAGAALARHAAAGDGMEVVLYEKVAIGSGQHSDNPWLQEMPDPITKATWDNYLLMSVADAEEHGIKATSVGRVFTLTVNNQSIELPVIVQPGMAKGTLAVAVGYGRTVCGKAGKDKGQNVYPLVTAHDGHFDYELKGATVSSTGRSYPIAQTQTHHVISSKHNLARRTVINEGILPSIDHTIEHIQKKRAEFKHLNDATLYPGHAEAYAQGHHWKMSIDLNTCIGCGACTVACQAENNVPVVGKEEVIRVHEMHWIRIDRYYTGEDLENPDVVFQPMLCQHCDNAPCENVCPVAATNHSTEGLNQMIYNRCIGTRYCANNCPYKVRRFNWFDWLGADSFFTGTIVENLKDPYELSSDLTRMVLNPDVTVRSRGVMEKCSFCVQRLQEGKLAAKKDGRKLRDKEIKTACMQACPTHAISFGDYNDQASEVRKQLDGDMRTFYVIEEINTQPSIGYQAKIRNRSEAENAERRGLSSDDNMPKPA